MLVDLKTLSATKGPQRFDFRYGSDWWPDSPEFEQVKGFEGPLHVHMEIFRSGDRYVLEGHLRGTALLRCDRCLEMFPSRLDTTFRIFLVPGPAGGQEEMELTAEDLTVDFISDDQVDLDAVIREQVCLTLPVKLLCSAGCRGLCPVCGANLNQKPCACEVQEGGHPGLRRLRNLKLKEKEN